ncbi:MAG: hypothetical protein EOP00_07155 [Pedobacter sp.]|nr:MAG: hypothetical protein EOP00_07155 [Pedobacter sp.]
MASNWLDYFLLFFMKNIYLFLIFIFVATTNLAIAQQKKPIKKPVPFKAKPPKIYVPPPVKQIETVTVAPPSAPGLSYSPTIMEDPSASKFNKNSICAECDTLTLQSNKPSIIIYDVKWMANSESKTYKEQPTEKDLTQSYYALSRINRREWDELRRNFPEDNFNYHYVYRNTFINIPNKKQQTLNLLNRQNRHEGFLYWSGKENDSTLNKKVMTRLTEAVAKARGENKISSYYSSFAKDSTDIERLQQTKKPSINLVDNMNTLLQEEIFDETILPIQFFNIHNVKQITIQSVKEQNKRIVLKLNEKGQLIQLNERTDSTTISYQDNLPIKAIDRYKNPINFYYQGDSLIIKKNDYLKIYRLVDKMFIEVKTYNISKESYEKMTLENGSEIKLSKDPNLCVTEFIDERDYASKICYSNTNWQLPLTVSNSNSQGNNSYKSNFTYKINEEQNLVLEDVNEYKSTRRAYMITDKKPASIKSTIKRGNEQYGEPYILNITYEYFK